MNSMRKRLITKTITISVLILTLIALPIATVSAQQLKITAGISWDLAIKGGITYMFTPNFGIKTDIGYSPFSGEGNLALTYDLLFVMKQKIPNSNFDAGTYVGIPTGLIVFTNPIALMNAVGISIFGSYSITDTMDISLRLGAGYPIFLKENQWSAGDTRFLLGLWPDLALELGFNL